MDEKTLSGKEFSTKTIITVMTARDFNSKDIQADIESVKDLTAYVFKQSDELSNYEMKNNLATLKNHIRELHPWLTGIENHYLLDLNKKKLYDSIINERGDGLYISETHRFFEEDVFKLSTDKKEKVLKKYK